MNNTLESNRNENFIYINGFWNGFIDKTDGNHIGFFEKLFKRTKLDHFTITTDLNKANILLESVFEDSMYNAKEWKYKILFSGEHFLNKTNLNNYDIVLCNQQSQYNIIDLPLFSFYIQGNHGIEKLIERPIIRKVPEKFCCFIVSNPHEWVRNKMFDIINSYRKVDSWGKFKNNIGYFITNPYWSNEYIEFISQYKFILCFENHKGNTYITEKIANAYLSNSIPIYWGTHHVKNVFNMNSMLFLEDENDEKSYYNLLQKIIELDNDDEKYLEFANQPVITNDFFQNNYSIENIRKQMNSIIHLKTGCIVIDSNHIHRKKYITNLKKFFSNTNVIFKKINGIFTDKILYDARFTENVSLRRGEIGCALAHIDALKTAIDMDLDYAFIFEDDVEITVERYDILKEWLDNLPEYDICLVTNIGSFEGIGHDGRIHKNTIINDCKYTTCPFGSQAYYISRKIIHLLYETQINLIKQNKIYISDGLPIHCEKAPSIYLDNITPVNNERFFKHANEESVIGSISK